MPRSRARSEPSGTGRLTAIAAGQSRTTSDSAEPEQRGRAVDQVWSARSARDGGVILAEREADQPLRDRIGQEARQLATELRRQDAQAGEQRARRDKARAQPGDLEVARQIGMAEPLRIDPQRERLE